MKLFLIITEQNKYSTNAKSREEAIQKFYNEYPDYFIDTIKEINVEDLVKLEDNDDIIFF